MMRLAMRCAPNPSLAIALCHAALRQLRKRARALHPKRAEQCVELRQRHIVVLASEETDRVIEPLPEDPRWRVQQRSECERELQLSRAEDL
jgi:hypothetical protein